MSEITGRDDFRAWVRSVLGTLGADPGQQAAHVAEAGVGVDELALQFDDVLNVARARLADGTLTEAEYGYLRAVNDALDVLDAAPDEVWDVDSLGSSAEWAKVREAARLSALELTNLWTAAG